MPTPDDLAEVIARVKAARDWLVGSGPLSVPITVDDLTAILDAAEAGMRARNAALEEAAKVAGNEAKNLPNDEWHQGFRSGCKGAASAIRALKEKKP